MSEWLFVRYLFSKRLVPTGLRDNVVGCCNVDICVEDIGVVTLVYLV